MKSMSIRRLALPLAAGVVTSAVVAAFGIAAQSGSQTAAAAQAPAPTGQVAGELRLGNGPAIPILSFSAGASNSGSFAGGGGGGAGKASFSSLSLTKAVDANTPTLYLRVANGTHLNRALFTAQWGAGGSAATMTYDLEDVIVESLQQSGGGTGAPTESLSLAFGKVSWTYADAAGTTTGSWDVVNNSER
jgi:type VI secretion system secreted protein Hcp